MMQQQILLKDATIINEGSTQKGHLLLGNGLIEQVWMHREPIPDTIMRHASIYELDGHWVFPGVIDDQVHFREPGLEYKGDIMSESRAAVAGGITSFMEMPNTIPQTTTQEQLENKFSLAAKKSLANYSFYIGATNENIDQLKATDRNHVCGIKVFMGSSTGNMLVDNVDALRDIFRIQKIPVATHCEDETTIRTNLGFAEKQFGKHIPFYQHPVIRSHEACEKSTRLAISLAEQYQTRLHLLHLSTANELRLLDNSTALHDKQITAEVCIHHLWFSERDYEEKNGFIKWNPAIKSEADRQALRNGLLNGYLDVVATDHAPHSLEEKSRTYLECPSGGPMVQHALLAMLELAHKGLVSPEKIAEVMCHNPAICFQIKGRGFIRKGYAADIVVVAPNTPYKVSEENTLYKCRWSPFMGYEFKSSIVCTFVNGHPVYEYGKVMDEVKSQALVFSR